MEVKTGPYHGIARGQGRRVAVFNVIDDAVVDNNAVAQGGVARGVIVNDCLDGVAVEGSGGLPEGLDGVVTVAGQGNRAAIAGQGYLLTAIDAVVENKNK